MIPFCLGSIIGLLVALVVYYYWKDRGYIIETTPEEYDDE